MADEEWGPWIDHDGGPNPVPGQVVRMAFEGPPGVYAEAEALSDQAGPSWEWENFGAFTISEGRLGRCARVMRYRLRRPPSAAMDLLRAIAAEPARPREVEPA